ncbi:MAG TPA: MauE/DoxX family redox-associated membrane protein [Bryobacteraceae bacterium]
MTSSPGKVLRIISIALRLGLGAVFGYAAWTKLREPWMLFAMSVDAYHVLPEWGAVAVARTLPWLELMLAVTLVAGIWKRITLPAASALLAVFFGLMVRSYARGEGIDCGCFGTGEAISPITLLRDGGLLAISLFLTATAFGNRSEKSHKQSAG